jgi:hypothetical protein
MKNIRVIILLVVGELMEVIVKLIVCAAVFLMITMASSAVETYGACVELPVTVSIQVPKPVDVSVSASTTSDSEVICCLKEVSDVNAIPKKFYSTILKLGSEKPLNDEFCRVLLSAWGIQDMSAILNPDEVVPVLVAKICAAILEAQKGV